MHRLKITALALSLSSVVMLTGCGAIKEKIPFLNKSEETSTEESTEAEQQSLIGTYTDDGLSIIVGFDENGWAITEPVDQNVATQNTLGASPDEFLNNPAYYDSVSIVTRNEQGSVLSTVHYQVDYDSKTARKDWFNNRKNIGTTYYDNYNNKAYTNLGMTEWKDINGERLDNIIMLVEPRYFELTEYTSDSLYAYIKGNLNIEAVGSNTVLMNEVYKQINTLTEMQLFNIYNIETKELLRSEITVTCPQGVYTVSAVPENTSYYIEIPDYVKNRQSVETPTKAVDGIVNIPLRAYLYSALYSTDDPESITREWLITEYEFRAAELEDKYQIEDVETFLSRMMSIDDEFAVDEFMNSYAEKNDNYDTNVEKAVYDIIYNRLIERDSSLTQDIFDAMVLKPEPTEVEESTEESTEGEESTEVEEESTEEESTEEESTEEDEPQYTIMYCNGTTVNLRKGPGTNYDKVGQAHLDDEIWVIGDAEEDSAWSECIDSDGNTYFIKSSFLRAE